MSLPIRMLLIMFVLDIPLKALFDVLIGSGITRSAEIMGLPNPTIWGAANFLVSVVAAYFIGRAVWRDRDRSGEARQTA